LDKMLNGAVITFENEQLSLKVKLKMLEKGVFEVAGKLWINDEEDQPVNQMGLANDLVEKIELCQTKKELEQFIKDNKANAQALSKGYLEIVNKKIAERMKEL